MIIVIVYFFLKIFRGEPQNFKIFFGFEPQLILRLLTTSESQRIVFNSLWKFYFIIKQNKSGAE